MWVKRVKCAATMLAALSAAAQIQVSFVDLHPRQEGRVTNSLAAVEAYLRGGAAVWEAAPMFDILRQERHLPPVADPPHSIH